jgi:hypothetical protein
MTCSVLSTAAICCAKAGVISKAEAASRKARDFMLSPFQGLRADPSRAQFADFPDFPGIFPKWQKSCRHG